MSNSLATPLPWSGPRASQAPARSAAPRARRGLPGGVRRMGSTVMLLAAWQGASSLGLIRPQTLASPVAILASLATLLADGTLEMNLLVSLGRVAAGLAIAVVLGTGLALLSGLSRLGEEAVDAPLQMLRTLPHLALVPLIILWFGIGETPKVLLVALGAIFPIYLNLVAGIRGVDPKLVEAGRTLGLSRAGMVRHVVLPGALPSFLVGLRYAVGIGWLSLAVDERATWRLPV